MEETVPAVHMQDQRYRKNGCYEDVANKIVKFASSWNWRLTLPMLKNFWVPMELN
jgi:hypothetical protein